MCKTRQNHQNPGLIQKSKVPKWVCRSPLASFCNGPPFFAIFGPARGQIFGKKVENILKNRLNFAFFGCATYCTEVKGYSEGSTCSNQCCRSSLCQDSRKQVKVPGFEISYKKRPKKDKNPSIFAIFSAFFPYIWPLAGPNIWKKGGPLQALARVDRQTHFGTFDFWIKPGF